MQGFIFGKHSLLLLCKDLSLIWLLGLRGRQRNSSIFATCICSRYRFTRLMCCASTQGPVFKLENTKLIFARFTYITNLFDTQHNNVLQHLRDVCCLLLPVEVAKLKLLLLHVDELRLRCD